MLHLHSIFHARDTRNIWESNGNPKLHFPTIQCFKKNPETCKKCHTIHAFLFHAFFPLLIYFTCKDSVCQDLITGENVYSMKKSAFSRFALAYPGICSCHFYRALGLKPVEQSARNALLFQSGWEQVTLSVGKNCN